MPTIPIGILCAMCVILWWLSNKQLRKVGTYVIITYMIQKPTLRANSMCLDFSFLCIKDIFLLIIYYYWLL